MSEIDDLEAYETPRSSWGKGHLRRPNKTKEQRLAAERARWQERYDNDPVFREHTKRKSRESKARVKQKREAGAVGEAC